MVARHRASTGIANRFPLVMSLPNQLFFWPEQYRRPSKVVNHLSVC
jgi:hypothetical protein